ncbi:hypothetical protein ACHRVW_06965 [Flavobacterium collinsii]|jgi:hypothetical protein|uniref:Lipoprotein n=1 Tax=Flavobacterium collinsii TaxID=1114861 RepID=A0A9W4X6R1_9FLAO|nr:hypothetical protein [Flavobacterium collinsii]GIQ58282.1 hypothetical protein Flavo103_14180 [Flavobacterium collinsii]CAA9199949.1 hypothetical protein FLACOL7796_02963 [Flavobacterium collinsii]CAI2767467.1 conserved protein of unknown function [Flavobacterium collinsii]
MIRRISRVLFAVSLVLLLISCKNTKQKLQEYVASYNATAANFKSENVTLTTARGYINDNKIELRFETDLPETEPNKQEAQEKFPQLLKELIGKDQIFKELVEEGVQFHVYFLANDNTVLAKEIVNKEVMTKLIQN